MSKKEEQVIDLLIELAEVRDNLATSKAAKKALEESVEYKASLDEVYHHSETLKFIELKLRALGQEIYDQTGENDILHGIKHKTDKIVFIANEVKALEYCRDKFFDGLALDIKALTKHVKSAKYPLDFITISELDKISLPKKINLTALELASGEKIE